MTDATASFTTECQVAREIGQRANGNPIYAVWHEWRQYLRPSFESMGTDGFFCVFCGAYANYGFPVERE